MDTKTLTGSLVGQIGKLGDSIVVIVDCWGDSGELSVVQLDQHGPLKMSIISMGHIRSLLPLAKQLEIRQRFAGKWNTLASIWPNVDTVEKPWYLREQYGLPLVCSVCGWREVSKKGSVCPKCRGDCA